VSRRTPDIFTPRRALGIFAPRRALGIFEERRGTNTLTGEEYEFACEWESSISSLVKSL
jgi:hypothetical protein